MRSEAETLAQTVIPDDSSNEEKEIQLLRRENEKLKVGVFIDVILRYSLCCHKKYHIFPNSRDLDRPVFL